MRRYMAIGHWDDSKNVTCVASVDSSIANFRDTLGGNGFIPYVVLSEKKFKDIIDMVYDVEDYDTFDIYKEVKKMTTNYRVWNVVTDYIIQCNDIMVEKMVVVA